MIRKMRHSIGRLTVFLMLALLTNNVNASFILVVATNETVALKTNLMVKGPPLTPFTTYVVPVSLTADKLGTCDPLVPPFGVPSFNGTAVFLQGFVGWFFIFLFFF